MSHKSNVHSSSVYRYVREGVAFQRYSSSRRVTEHDTFLGICSHFDQNRPSTQE